MRWPQSLSLILVVLAVLIIPGGVKAQQSCQTQGFIFGAVYSWGPDWWETAGGIQFRVNSIPVGQNFIIQTYEQLNDENQTIEGPLRSFVLDGVDQAVFVETQGNENLVIVSFSDISGVSGELALCPLGQNFPPLPTATPTPTTVPSATVTPTVAATPVPTAIATVVLDYSDYITTTSTLMGDAVALGSQIDPINPWFVLASFVMLVWLGAFIRALWPRKEEQ